jgi:hypothetical protein
VVFQILSGRCSKTWSTLFWTVNRALHSANFDRRSQPNRCSKHMSPFVKVGAGYVVYNFYIGRFRNLDQLFIVWADQRPLHRMAWRAGTPERARVAALPRLMHPVHGLVRTHHSSGSPRSYYTHTLQPCGPAPLRVSQVAAAPPPASPRRTRALPAHPRDATVSQLAAPVSLEGEVDVLR